MKKSISLLILILVTFSSIAQDYNLPYRVGDKFGVANSNGDMLIDAQFDMIAPLFSRGNDKRNSFFVAHILKDSSTLTSFIVNDKIILKHKPYAYYYLGNKLVNTIEYVFSNIKDKWGNSYTERHNLFTYDGKRIIKGEYKYLSLINIIEGDTKSDEVLIFAANLEDHYSLHLYDKTSQNITKTFFENSSYIDHSEYDRYDEKSFTYKTPEGIAKKIYLTYDKNKRIIIKANKTVEISEKDDYYDDYDVEEAIPNFEEKKETFQLDLKDSIALKIKKVSLKRYSYLLPKRKEKLEFGSKTLNKDYSYVVIRDQKVGAKKGKDGSVMLPTVYDDIYYGDFSGRHNGYILKQNTLYGLYIFSYPESILIEPKYKMLPMLSSMNYPNKGKLLIKLFDENNEFFCYANQDGVLYYSEN